MITLLALSAGFVLPLALHSPEPESLRSAARPSLAQRLRGRAGTLLLGLALIALAAVTFAEGSMTIDPELEARFALSRSGVIEEGRFLQLVTSNFLHVNLLHLVSNLAVLMLLSVYEWRVGALRYLSVFAVAAIGSSVIELPFMQNGTVALGASAGICGLAAAYFLDYRDLLRKEWTIGIVAVLALVALYSFTGQHETPTISVDWMSHLAGALVGGVYVRLFPFTDGALRGSLAGADHRDRSDVRSTEAK